MLALAGIQKLVLAGRMGEAIETTQKLYPGLLEGNPNLLFLLRCRQFVEMVNGTDGEARPARRSPGASPRLLLLSSSPKASPDVASNGVAPDDQSTANGDASLNGNHGTDEDCMADMVVEGGEGRTVVSNGVDVDSRQHNGHLHRLEPCGTEADMGEGRHAFAGRALSPRVVHVHASVGLQLVFCWGSVTTWDPGWSLLSLGERSEVTSLSA